MQVGFAVVILNEQAEFQFFGRRPEDPRSLVSHARQGRLHAVLMGRLTYRSELVKQLPPETASADMPDDAALALAAYRCWGPAGLTRLEGCFALVVWDGDKKHLLGSRDPRGGYPLFWTKHPEGLAFGTCLRPLLQLLPRRSLNLDYLAEFLALPGAALSEPATPQCAYEGVYRVSPGAAVQARAAEGQVREQRYWDWQQRMIDPGTGRLEEVGELVADGLRRAVAEQLRGRVASHLSGGMDSTAVALLARDALGQAPGRPPLHAVSLVFERLDGLSRETPYVESALGQAGLVPHRVRGDDLLDYDGFVNPPQHDEPWAGLFRANLLGKMVQAAVGVGADTLLTGYGAEAVIDQAPHHLADLLRRSRLLSAWRDAKAWGLAKNRSAWSFLWKFGVAPLLPAAWRPHKPGAVAPWIRPEFTRSQALRQRALRHLKPAHRSSTVAAAIAMLQSTHGDCLSWYAAAPHGLAHVHPFLDTRFASLCLGIQSRFRQDPRSQKPLLACAMRDVLPEAIRNRRSKGHYNALVHRGLARNLPFLETLIREAPVDDLGVFDKEVLIQHLHQTSLGYMPTGMLDKLNLTLAWLRWCSLQAEQQRPMTPVTVFCPAARTPEGRAVAASV
ncbi:MAG TPA: asparagine synthase-related protein [Gemmataceae bacterium]|nr:asparagine synthase-related protein [Gemmataceae bacterium]